jgi:CheY-like chemotaxis protein
VAKILVADDNSNVQKTMALALADLGVEVVSVNNGEAAVRKLADVSPDLILADIFMPVRNGYEVCEYVKKDSRFAHIPVILLVGAFDPLDEREAQRVGADGILKKPFVPPDPLIAMVKTLLDRSMSERLVGVAASKTPVAVQVKVASGRVPEAQATPPSLPAEPSPEEFPVPAGKVTFAEGDRPVAFGQLLDSPAQSASTSDTGVLEPVDNEQVLTSSRDATLGEPSFWRNDSPEVEPEAEHSTDSKNELSLHKWGQEKESLTRREDAAMLRAVEPVELVAPVEPVEPLELIRDEPEIESTSTVDTGPVVLDQAAQAPLTVESGKAPELAANPLEWLATAPPQNPEAAREPISGWDEKKSEEVQLAPEPFPGRFQAAPTPISSTEEAEVEPVTFSGGLSFETQDRQVEPVPVSKPSFEARDKHVEPAPVSDDFSFGTQGKEVEPALASNAFKSKSVVEPAKHSEFVVEPETQSAKGAVNKSPSQTPPLTPATESPEDTARSMPISKWAEMTDTLEKRATEVLTQHLNAGSASAQNSRKPSSPIATLKPWQGSQPDASSKPEAPVSPAANLSPAEPADPSAPSSTSGVPDPALVEAVVQRVLDKMRPQVVDIITKEFLRPVVQALVHREIEKQ